jgi:hypothetical protein
MNMQADQPPAGSNPGLQDHCRQGEDLLSRVICRLPLRGNRRLNHAIHMAAVTQIRCRHSKGRAYYDRKMAEGKTSKEAAHPLPPASAQSLPPGTLPRSGNPGR